MTSSQLDYCNSFFFGTSKENITKLQRIQDNLIGIVKNKPRRTHASDLLIDLHWLPISSCVQFDIALMAFKVLNTGTPQYLSDQIHVQTDARNTRNSGSRRLHQLISTGHAASRGFQYAEPTVWNSLPNELHLTTVIDPFKKSLKTYLVRIAYDC